MKKILFVSNIESPYRVTFFNELSSYCRLTVLYERKVSSNRDPKWNNNARRKYNSIYLNGLKIGNERGFSLGIFKYIFKPFDEIIFGCFNSPIEILAIMVMKLLRRKYNLIFDGEIYASDKGIKSRIKRLVIGKAERYFCAGEKSLRRIGDIVGKNRVFVYWFSSLTEEEIKNNRYDSMSYKERKDIDFLIVGQYFKYKGIDLVAEIAKKDKKNSYVFVGAGKRAETFILKSQIGACKNITVIPFLDKSELRKLYLRSKCLILPSRKECWGLVVNEAASFGIPIISTIGSGAAIEFLQDKYSKYLAKTNDVDSIKNCIRYLDDDNLKNYRDFLFEKSEHYSIEKSADSFVRGLGLGECEP